MHKWLFLDLNGYFASVEQQVNPELRGKPVAVVPMIADNTSCIAVSYEAKAFGVKGGTRVADAKAMCPGLILREADHHHYIDYHERIIEAVDSVLPVDRVCSIDEMAFRLMGTQREEANAIKLAHALKKVILTQVGSQLKCSIGIAPNRYLAKIACDMQKPDGLIILNKEELPGRLVGLKLRDLPGVGHNMESRLHRYGIFTMEQLIALSEHELRQVWGSINGKELWHWLRGEETDEKPTQRTVVGHSHVLPPESRNWVDAEKIMKKLIHKAAVRLRKESFYAARISIHVKLLGSRDSGGGGYFENSLKLIETQDTREFVGAFRELWKNLPETPPLRVGVDFSDLIEAEHHTPSLFEDPKAATVTALLDNINKKFGRDKIYFGAVHEAIDAAPTRIAFSRIPSKDEV